MIKVSVKSTAKLGDAWDVEKPVGFDISMEEPLRKSDGLGFMTVENVTVLVSLMQSGLSDWFVGKQAENFWTWFKACFAKTPITGRTGSLTVTVPSDKGPSLKVEFESLNADAIESVRATVIEKVSAVDRESKQEIYIKMKSKPDGSA